MTPRLISARHVGEYRIELTYDDGARGVIDLESELWGEVFEPLKDLAVFPTFELSEELGTLVWPNGADLAPEFLYAKVAAA
ncbi:MAG: molybdopterin-guanine dinucleotide biosynthesis protein MobA [Planctomycetota bacterium]|nr:MAG: molybdopterin-guanine dinucleotide biosynthesis protein MobA [Planctomycetota bacterium]